MRFTFLPNRRVLLFSFWMISLLFTSKPIVGQAIVQLPLKTGDYYGITVWGSAGEQTESGNNIKGYGVNLKYTSTGFWLYRVDIEEEENVTAKMLTAGKTSVHTQTRIEEITDPAAFPKYPVSGPDIQSYDTTRMGEETTIKIRRTHAERGADRIMLTHYDTTIQHIKGPTKDSCVYDTTMVCRAKNYHTIRASVGIGYLEYQNLRLPSSAVRGNFDIAAPYAGIYISLALPFLNGLIEHFGDNLSVAVAYTSAFPSSEIVSTYVGPELDVPGVGRRTEIPVSYKLSTKPTHEVACGLGYTISKLSLFLEGFYHFYTVTNVQFVPITGVNGFPKEDLQENIGSEFDLSSIGIKGGLSLNF